MFKQSCFFLINLVFMYKVIASILVVDKGILPLEENLIGIRFYVDVTNADRQNVCNVYSRCKKCCLIDSNMEDCDIMSSFGESFHVVKPRDRKTLLYVAPMLQQHDLNGYCDIMLNYNCKETTNKTEVIIPFDTRLAMKAAKTLMDEYIGSKKVSSCKTLDEDSLNNCEPVNCNTKYLDKRPVFDHNLHKCIEVPTCLTNLEKELPDYVYVPDSNICRNLDLPLTVQDIYAISTGLGTVTVPPASSTSSTFDVGVEFKSYCSTISQNLKLMHDLIYGKLLPVDVELDYSECFKSALMTIATCIISVCTALFLLVCCINTMVWLYIQWFDGNIKKMWKGVKNSMRRRKNKRSKRKRVNSTIRNALLREVIVKDIPVELRHSVIDMCDRMGREVKKKRRYRVVDTGIQIDKEEGDSPISSTSSSSLEKAKESSNSILLRHSVPTEF
ncbi:uncharacterized protein [Epargyreus clarus]|uniref:uncharacterized protein n=1 Tax=Epargyreus clarus TaxID=520877 RepID=UPI003C2AED91